MTGYRAPVAELEFLLSDIVRVADLSDLPGFKHLDWNIARGVLREGARLAEQQIAPVNAIGDREGAKLDAKGRVVLPAVFSSAWHALCRDGWLGLDLPQANGGQGLPRLLQAAFAEMTNGACVSFCMLPLMSRASARLLLAHAEKRLAALFVPGLLAGDVAATICISEPQAGSDVGRIRTRAVPAGDGTYRITGSKSWISYGDHGLAPQITHMVLARRPEAPPGTAGLSLFLVPKLMLDENAGWGKRNPVRVVSLETKMGLHASPTCTLDFDDAVAYPIGPAGRGLACLFTMVNTMRLEVAVQGVALAGAATAAALDYAGERRQGGPPDQPPVPIVRHPDVRRMLLTMRARTEGLRALTLEAARQLDLAEHISDEQARDDAAALASWLLPVCKAYATDTATEVTNLALQVHGGAGYVLDTGIEQYVRDARVGAIYEGTNGIQALDLVTRRLVGDQGKRLALFAERVRADLDAAGQRAQTKAIHAAVAAGLDALERCGAHLLESQRDHSHCAAAATPFLRLAGLLGSGWMWLQMAAAARGESRLHRRKKVCAAFFAEQLMPEAGWLEQQVMAGAASLDDLSDDALMET